MGELRRTCQLQRCGNVDSYYSCTTPASSTILALNSADMNATLIRFRASAGTALRATRSPAAAHIQAMRTPLPQSVRQLRLIERREGKSHALTKIKEACMALQSWRAGYLLFGCT